MLGLRLTLQGRGDSIGDMAFGNSEDQVKLFGLLRKTSVYSGADFDELRRVSVCVGDSGTDWREIAGFRASIEVIAAIRQLDRASGALVDTTNILTKKILRLTIFGVVFAGIAVLLSLWLSFRR
jgi:hypothetical protein